jgi:hypothetical protein
LSLGWPLKGEKKLLVKKSNLLVELSKQFLQQQILKIFFVLEAKIISILVLFKSIIRKGLHLGRL